MTATGNDNSKKLRKFIWKPVPLYELNKYYRTEYYDEYFFFLVIFYSSTKPLTKILDPVPTRLAKPPIVAE